MAFDIRVPDVTFKVRRETTEAPGFEWYDLKSQEIFGDKRVAIFSLPGAFTPTCSSTHLPGYDLAYNDLKAQGIDEVYCISVNDTFVMNAWFNSQNVENVKPIPDGAGEFTRKMGFLVDKTNIGFGMRSWRYSMIVNDGLVEALFVEPGIGDNEEGDPFVVSGAPVMLEHLEG